MIPQAAGHVVRQLLVAPLHPAYFAHPRHLIRPSPLLATRGLLSITDKLCTGPGTYHRADSVEKSDGRAHRWTTLLGLVSSPGGPGRFRDVAESWMHLRTTPCAASRLPLPRHASHLASASATAPLTCGLRLQHPPGRVVERCHGNHLPSACPLPRRCASHHTTTTLTYSSEQH